MTDAEVPPLKVDPKHGYFPWWPEDGDAWVHPEDVERARSLIPSQRVFRRDGTSGPLIVLHYGDIRLRVRRTLWQEVHSEGFNIGDVVEVRSRGMHNEPRTGVIAEMLWDEHAGELRYQITDRDRLIETMYTSSDLKHVEPAMPEVEVRIEPPADWGDNESIPLTEL
jgi:hypothetical protein